MSTINNDNVDSSVNCKKKLDKIISDIHYLNKKINDYKYINNDICNILNILNNFLSKAHTELIFCSNFLNINHEDIYIVDQINAISYCFDNLNNCIEFIISPNTNSFPDSPESKFINAIITAYDFLDKVDYLYENIASSMSTAISTQYKLYEDNYKLFQKLSNQELDLNTKISTKFKHLKTIESNLNQQGLSASFHNRAQNLDHKSMLWLACLAFVALLFLGLAINHIPTLDEIKTISDIKTHLWKYLVYTPFAVTSFWLIWFCSKNYFYTSRLRDNYNFKNDLSKAFYGYHKEAMELNDDQNILLKQLLGGLIANICDNPVKEKKEDHSSPVTEILSQICKITNVKDKVDVK